MSRRVYKTGRTPIDLAEDRKPKRESARFGEAVGPVPELSEERRWDALRAVTYQHQRVAPILSVNADRPLSGVREVLEMLGLVVIEKRTGGMPVPVEREALLAAVAHPERRVRCPECGSPPGEPCRKPSGNNRAYQRGHVARRRRAEEQK